jgi:hypothetical protein
MERSYKFMNTNTQKKDTSPGHFESGHFWIMSCWIMTFCGYTVQYMIVIRAGHKVRWSVEALKSVEPLNRWVTEQRLFDIPKKRSLTVRRIILKKIMLSAFKFAFFESTVTEQRLFFSSSHLEVTEQHLTICFIKIKTLRQRLIIKNTTSTLFLNVISFPGRSTNYGG